MVIETCPKCGHDLMNLVLTCNPPIPQKICNHCGWSWTGKREEVVRVPFKDPDEELTLVEKTLIEKDNTEVKSINSLDELMEMLTPTQIEFPSIPDLELAHVNDIPKSCRGCLNHPSNGGSGVCHCILGLPEVTC